ncbi:MAG TPA: NAD-dependent protein deacylase [Anaerovoracaceae bacterium]|nr:NAD-dependent protein deacylase [Anaerovoracaceae bacterium]
MNKELKEIIDNSDNVVFFGGAGVSTESNIPDFRSDQGLYNAKSEYGKSPEDMISHSFYVRNTETFYKYYKKNLIHREAKPNKAHIALAELEAVGKVKAVITQNIDGLHQLAGSKEVYELHGSVLRNYCIKCGEFHDLEYIMNEDNCENGVPKCSKCGSIVKPDVVLYEEPLFESVINGAVSSIMSADTLIIGGTSLVVYPAAGLITYFKGKNLVLINKSKTPYDNKADLVINDSIGKVMGD